MMHRITRLIALPLILLLFMLFWSNTGVSQGQDELYMVTCPDQTQLIGHRLTIPNLSGGDTLEFNLIGVGDFPARMAIIRSADDVECSAPDETLIGSAVAVPGLGRVEAKVFISRETYSPSQGTLDVIIGGAPGVSGQWAVIINNLSIDNNEEKHTMQVAVPPASRREWMGVFMMAGVEESLLDPYIVMTGGIAEDGIRLECDNAGTASCPNSTTMFERGVVFADNEELFYVGDVFDAGVLGVFPYGKLVYEFSAARADNSGSYLLIATGTAPGNINDSSLICDNVVSGVQDASPAYNSLYPPLNLLDGDPITRYVTTAPPPETPNPVPTYIVLQLSGVHVVDRVRIGGYISNPELQPNPNSPQTVAIAFLGETATELVVATTVELRPQPTYQTIDFLPTQTTEVGIILQTNFGGSLYEIADIQVCAAQTP